MQPIRDVYRVGPRCDDCGRRQQRAHAGTMIQRAHAGTMITGELGWL